MIVIVDYGVGNVASVKNMLARNGAECIVTGDAAKILNATKLILPGVGAFDAAMSRLNELHLVPVLQQFAASGKPLLGICLGAQILLQSSEEGKLEGLKLIEGKCIRFRTTSELKIPHMEWSDVKFVKSHPLSRFETDPRFYFVHSYHMECDDSKDILGVTNYGYEFTSAISRNNIMGVQFHPEKSHRFGSTLLQNFISL